jgi:hypothetical protein
MSAVIYEKFKKEGDSTAQTVKKPVRKRRKNAIKDNGLGVDMNSIMNAPYIPVANTVVIRTLRATITHLSKLNHVYNHVLFNSKIPFPKPAEIKSVKDRDELKKTAQEFLSYLFCEFGRFENGRFIPTMGLRSEIKKIIKDTEVEEGDAYREKEAFFANGILNLVESEMFDQLIVDYPESIVRDGNTVKQHMERLSNYIKQIVDPIVLTRATYIRNAVIDVVKEICETEHITFPPITPKQKALITSTWDIAEEDADQLNKIQASHLIDSLLKKDIENKGIENENSLFRER